MSIVLPLITVQDDFQAVIADIQDAIAQEELFWVSCYKQDCESVHGRVSVRRKQGIIHGDSTSLDLIPDKIEFKKDEHVRI